MAPLIGYWNVRGNLESIILTLKQAKVSFKVRRYKLGDAPDFDKSDWLNEKYKLGLDYPNVPYYIDGDIKITQTLAILRYLARKHDLGPRNDAEAIRSDIVEQGIFEMMNSLWTATHVETDQEFEKCRPGFETYLVEKLAHTANVLGSNKFVLGDRVTYVDFLLYTTLDYIRLFKPSSIDPHANLKSYLDRIEALPEINKYYKSEGFSRFPITYEIAKWGNLEKNAPF
ncbi:glutathione S-transferase Mu 1-like [Tetranychus urticae]|uniref:glutathione transferase n=1 Tax=Tetranychus urticae TaxID=32264 RepID=T1K574_TETUR|nr:glutathione S-transferase Mu 1-like [Tetranychus urticae]